MLYDQCAHRREAWLLRQVPTLSRCDGALLRRLLAGEAFPDMAEAEGIQHRTIDMRSRHVLKPLKTRLRETPISPARAEPHSSCRSHQCDFNHTVGFRVEPVVTQPAVE